MPLRHFQDFIARSASSRAQKLEPLAYRLASAVQQYCKLVGEAAPVQAYKLACLGNSVPVVDHVPTQPSLMVASLPCFRD